MRSREFTLLTESRGVTARAPGETYVSDSDPSDILTIQNIDIISPPNAQNYETPEELLDAVAEFIPPGGTKIDDNQFVPGTGANASRAALIATVKDASGSTQYWVRFVRTIPPQGVHTMWKTLRGYKFSKGSKEESIPIKPADLVPDENSRSPMQLAKLIKNGVNQQVKGTQYEPLAPIMSQAVDLALRGQVSPIKGGAEYSRVVAKYGGEYLGPIAVIQGGVTKGDISKMLDQFGIPSLAGTTVRFPSGTTEELIDSVFTLPNGTELNVSTKIHKGGGAASSLSGIVKQMNPAIRKKYPTASNIIDILGMGSAVGGPIKAAFELGILDAKDVAAFNKIDKSSQDIKSVGSAKLRKIIQNQGYREGSDTRSDYRVFYHALAAIVNQIIIKVNAMPEFTKAMLAALNNNNYLQLVTDARETGKDLTLDYYGKFPAVFEGKPQLYNKSYFVTGQKGRLGFKLM